MEHWFVDNMIRSVGLPFVVDSPVKTLNDVKRHYLSRNEYSFSLRELKYPKKGETFEKAIVNFVADILVGPVNFGYSEIAFYVYACRVMGIPPMHVTYSHMEHVCIKKIGSGILGRPNAYSVNGITYDLPVGESAFEFVKRDLIHRIPEETNVLCEFDNNTFGIHKSKTDDHYNVKAFVEWAGESTICLIPLQKYGLEVERFNYLVEPYQSRYEEASVKGAVYEACSRQKRIGNFRVIGSRVYFDDYDKTAEIIDYIKTVGEYKVLVERESKTVGYMSESQAGNVAAAYNILALRINKPLINFRYRLIKPKCQTNQAPPINRFWNLTALLARKYPGYGGDPVPIFEMPSTSQTKYEQLLLNTLNIKRQLEHEGKRVFAEYTGNVVHIKVLVTGSPCKHHIINKPLVNFISKHKRETSSYYTQILAPVTFVSKDIKINCNFQGGEYLIRSKLAGFRCRLGLVCASNASSNQEEEVKISNQCIVAPGLMGGVINSHSFRNRTYMESANAVKISSFPGVHIIGVNKPKTTGDKNNILHRESVLVRMHKKHDMRDNIEELCKLIGPHVERIDDLHDLVYGIETKLRKTLKGYLLGIVKTMYFVAEGKVSVDEIINLFVNRVFLNNYVLAQNGVDSFGFMCHSLKDTTAIKTASIKTTNLLIGNPPPQVEYTNKLRLLNGTFKDYALTNDLKPRLRKKRGNFSPVMELAQAPTRIVNGSVGMKFGELVRKKLIKLGGYEKFADSMTAFDTISGSKNYHKKNQISLFLAQWIRTKSEDESDVNRHSYKDIPPKMWAKTYVASLKKKILPKKPKTGTQKETTKIR